MRYQSVSDALTWVLHQGCPGSSEKARPFLPERQAARVRVAGAPLSRSVTFAVKHWRQPEADAPGEWPQQALKNNGRPFGPPAFFTVWLLPGVVFDHLIDLGLNSL